MWVCLARSTICVPFLYSLMTTIEMHLIQLTEGNYYPTSICFIQPFNLHYLLKIHEFINFHIYVLLLLLEM